MGEQLKLKGIATEWVTVPSGAEVERKSKTGLRPCPFCGSIQLWIISYIPPKESGDPSRALCVQCDDCGATGPHGKDETMIRDYWQIRMERKPQ